MPWITTACCLQTNKCRKPLQMHFAAAFFMLKYAEYRRRPTTGNVVTYGHYEQDNDTANGKEPIEWVVLDVQGDKALLISK